jgi:hypothetical protein
MVRGISVKVLFVAAGSCHGRRLLRRRYCRLELTDPPSPGGGVVAVTQGGPGQALEITLDNTPGDHTLKILFTANVDEASAIPAYSLELTTDADTVAATDLEYLGPFGFSLDPPDLILAAGPGAIVDDATQLDFTTYSGMLDLFEVTLVVSVPTPEIQVFSVIGDAEWAGSETEFTITIGDSDPLFNSPPGQVSSTPSIIIKTFIEPVIDCNSNGIPDADEIGNQPSLDCNTNGTLDSCEIAAQPALDCDTNGKLDTCEIAVDPTLDCNSNGILDSCDIAGGAADCNANGIPDSCELAAGAPDCNTNGILDACELAVDPTLDCNSNGVPDSCDIAGGAADCNANGIPDSCELAAGAPDCNTNGILDACEIAAGAADCDANGVPDSCEIAAGTSADCDWNGVPDSCEIASGAAADCNTNGRPDACDIAAGQSVDANTNGVPDECESPDETTPDQASPPAHVINRDSLYSFLAMICGVPSKAGLSLTKLPVQFFGPLGVPLGIVLGGLELLNLPTRLMIFEFSYVLLDAMLP